jgi:hypothetical protein
VLWILGGAAKSPPARDPRSARHAPSGRRLPLREDARSLAGGAGRAPTPAVRGRDRCARLRRPATAGGKDAQRGPVGEIGHGAPHHRLQGRLPVNRLRHPTARFGQKPDPFTAQLCLLPGPIGLGASLFCLEASVLGPDLSRFGIRAGHQGFPQPCRLVLLALPAVRHVTHPRLYYPRSPRLYTAQVWGAARGRRYRTVTYSPLLSSSAG